VRPSESLITFYPKERRIITNIAFPCVDLSLSNATYLILLPQLIAHHCWDDPFSIIDNNRYIRLANTLYLQSLCIWHMEPLLRIFTLTLSARLSGVRESHVFRVESLCGNILCQHVRNILSVHCRAQPPLFAIRKPRPDPRVVGWGLVI
jgi:hypothetical protein